MAYELLMRHIELRSNDITRLRNVEAQGLANHRDVSDVRRQLDEQERVLHRDLCALARVTNQPPPPPLPAPTPPVAVKPVPVAQVYRCPDPRPVGKPNRNPHGWAHQVNCYDLNNYPRDEFTAEREEILSDKLYPWAGGHYIAGAPIKVSPMLPSLKFVRCHEPPWVGAGHPSHVSETKVIMNHGSFVRVWADGVTPHS